MTVRALIDGDILCYRSGFAAEHSHYMITDREQGVPVKEFDSYADFRAWTRENEDWEQTYDLESYRTVEEVSHALANVKSTVSKILDAVDADEFVVFLSSGNNWRAEIATIKEYKGNRKDARKPEHYDAIHEYLQKYYGAIKLTSIEADDALAMCQTNDTVICSIDKDLLQVPGRHYNWVGDYKTLVAPEVGLCKLYQQVLTGDSTDNIPGIKGIGPVKARALMIEANTRDEEVMRAIAIDQWREYLATKADWCVWNADEGTAGYEDWRGSSVMVRKPYEVVNEVLSLLRVGGPEAYAALQNSGEEIPLPSKAEREACWASRPVPLVA